MSSIPAPCPPLASSFAPPPPIPTAHRPSLSLSLIDKPRFHTLVRHILDSLLGCFKSHPDAATLEAQRARDAVIARSYEELGIEKDNVTPCVCKEGEDVEPGCPYANVNANAGPVLEEEEEEERGAWSNPAFTKRRVRKDGWGWSYNPGMKQRWSRGSVDRDADTDAERYRYRYHDQPKHVDSWTRSEEIPGLRPPPRAFHLDMQGDDDEEDAWWDYCSSISSSTTLEELMTLAPPCDVEAQAPFSSPTEKTLDWISDVGKGVPPPSCSSSPSPSTSSTRHHNNKNDQNPPDSRTTKSRFRRFLSSSRRLLNPYVLTILLLNVLLMLCCLGVYLGVKRGEAS